MHSTASWLPEISSLQIRHQSKSIQLSRELSYSISMVSHCQILLYMHQKATGNTGNLSVTKPSILSTRSLTRESWTQMSEHGTLIFNRSSEADSNALWIISGHVTFHEIVMMMITGGHGSPLRMKKVLWHMTWRSSWKKDMFISDLPCTQNWIIDFRWSEYKRIRADHHRCTRWYSKIKAMVI